MLERVRLNQGLFTVDDVEELLEGAFAAQPPKLTASADTITQGNQPIRPLDGMNFCSREILVQSLRCRRTAIEAAPSAEAVRRQDCAVRFPQLGNGGQGIARMRTIIIRYSTTIAEKSNSRRTDLKHLRLLPARMNFVGALVKRMF